MFGDDVPTTGSGKVPGKVPGLLGITPGLMIVFLWRCGCVFPQQL